jgi:RNA polymerase sigma factor (sigma-70 family)
MVRISHDVPSGGDPFNAAVRREVTDSIWESARILPQKQFDALWLRYSEDLSVKEIAGVMGVTRVNVKVLLYRARTRLAGMQKRRKPIAPRTEEKRLQGILSH